MTSPRYTKCILKSICSDKLYGNRISFKDGLDADMPGSINQYRLEEVAVAQSSPVAA